MVEQAETIEMTMKTDTHCFANGCRLRLQRLLV